MANEKIYVGKDGAQELYRKVKAIIPPVDQELNIESTQAVSNHAVTEAFDQLDIGEEASAFKVDYFNYRTGVGYYSYNSTPPVVSGGDIWLDQTTKTVKANSGWYHVEAKFGIMPNVSFDKVVRLVFAVTIGRPDDAIGNWPNDAVTTQVDLSMTGQYYTVNLSGDYFVENEEDEINFAFVYADDEEYDNWVIVYLDEVSIHKISPVASKKLPSIVGQTLRLQFKDNGFNPVTIQNGGVWRPVTDTVWDWMCDDTDWSGKFKNSKFAFSVIDNGDISAVTSTKSMFENSKKLESVYIHGLSSVTDAESMFEDCYGLRTAKVFDTTALVNAKKMYKCCYSMVTVYAMDTSSVTNMESMFEECDVLRYIPDMDTSHVTNMEKFACGCSSIVNIPELSVESLENASRTFEGCWNADYGVEEMFQKIYSSTIVNKFNSCFALTGRYSEHASDVVEHIPYQYGGYQGIQPNTLLFRFDTDDYDPSVMFAKSNIVWTRNTESEYNEWFMHSDSTDWSQLLSSMIGDSGELIKIKYDVIAAGDTSSVTNMNNLFSNWSNGSETDEDLYELYGLTSVVLMDTKNVVETTSMFGENPLKFVPKFYTPLSQDCGSMFEYCLDLEEIPRYNFPNATNASWFNAECVRLKKIPPCDFSNADDIDYIFAMCWALTEFPRVKLTYSKLEAVYCAYKQCLNVGDDFIDVYNELEKYADKFNPQSVDGDSNAFGAFEDCGIYTEHGRDQLLQISNEWGGNKIVGPAWIVRFTDSSVDPFNYDLHMWRCSRPMYKVANSPYNDWYYSSADYWPSVVYMDYDNPELAEYEHDVISYLHDDKIYRISVNSTLVNHITFGNLNSISEVNIYSVPELQSCSFGNMPSYSRTGSMIQDAPKCKTFILGDMPNVTTVSSNWLSNNDFIENLVIGDIPLATSADNMLKNCSALKTLRIGSMNSLESATAMCQNCGSLTSVTISGLDNLTNALAMFIDCGRLTDVNIGALPNLQFANYMFANDVALVTIPGFNAANIYQCSYMFFNCPNVKNNMLEQYLIMSESPNKNSFTNCFLTCGTNTEEGMQDRQFIPKAWGGDMMDDYTLVFKFSNPDYNPNVIEVPDGATWTKQESEYNIWEFNYQNNDWTSVFDDKFDGDETMFDIIGGRLDSITSARYMFYNCYGLMTAVIPDMPRVLDLEGMFWYCGNVTKIHMGDTPSALSTDSMFCRCYELVEINAFDTSNVQNMMYMFRDCYELETLPAINTSKCTEMNNFCDFCTSLKHVPMYDMTSVIYCPEMFWDCEVLESVPCFDLSHVEYAPDMFVCCYSLKVLPPFDFSNATDIDELCEDCYLLEETADEIVVGGNNDTDVYVCDMFRSCYMLRKGPERIRVTSSMPERIYCEGIFDDCVRLKNAPVFDIVVPPITSLSFKDNFTNCYSLTDNITESYRSMVTCINRLVDGVEYNTENCFYNAGCYDVYTMENIIRTIPTEWGGLLSDLPEYTLEIMFPSNPSVLPSSSERDSSLAVPVWTRISDESETRNVIYRMTCNDSCWDDIFNGYQDNYFSIINGGDLSGVTSINRMFKNSSLCAICGMNTFNVISMVDTFDGASPVYGIITENVVNAHGMYKNTDYAWDSMAVAIGAMNFNSVEDASEMFMNQEPNVTNWSSADEMLSYEIIQKLYGVNLPNATNAQYMFAYDDEHIPEPSTYSESCTHVTFGKVENIDGIFRNNAHMNALLDIGDLSHVTSADNAFNNCPLIHMGILDMYNSLNNGVISSHTNCFANCGSETEEGAAELAEIPSDWK